MALTDVFSYDSSSQDPAPVRPWRLGSWVWATNGYLLVALKDDGREAEAPPDSKMKGLRYLDESPVDLQSVSLPSLRGFAGIVSARTEPCEDCHGEGRQDFGESVECEHCHQFTRCECRSCGGSGVVTPERRYGHVGGVTVNLALLAFALSEVPQDAVVQIGHMASIASKEAFRALAVVGATWRVVLMSCVDRSEKAPSFPARVVSPQTVSAVGEP